MKLSRILDILRKEFCQHAVDLLRRIESLFGLINRKSVANDEQSGSPDSHFADPGLQRFPFFREHAIVAEQNDTVILCPRMCNETIYRCAAMWKKNGVRNVLVCRPHDFFQTSGRQQEETKCL